MTVYKMAELPKWVEKVKRVHNAVVKQSANDLLASTPSAPGIMRGGSRTQGIIPLMDGALAGSLQSSLYGGTAMSGAESYVLVAGQMKAGDIATFAWGGAAAPHAMANHYGSSNMVGTFWVDIAANKWPSFVNGAVLKVRAAIQ